VGELPLECLGGGVRSEGKQRQAPAVVRGEPSDQALALFRGQIREQLNLCTPEA
jgi:hypothetical protein